MSCKIIVISLNSVRMHHQLFSSSNNENEMKQNFDSANFITVHMIWVSLLTKHYSAYDLGFISDSTLPCMQYGFQP